jgi:exodeoxyribonuclease VII large subunit
MSLFDPPLHDATGAVGGFASGAVDAPVSVGDFADQVRDAIERELPLVSIRGEISNFTRAASGHLYFVLKDARAQLRCVMFRGRAGFLRWSPRNGDEAVIRAQPTFYEPRGDFQLQVDAMQPAGAGALHERFEQLKRALLAEGLFDAQRKRALPAVPTAIGIVTSPQAAALRDVLTTLRARWPRAPVVLYPAPVQGEGSAERLAAAIATASARNEVDVLIVCRGGGSLEDLWAFNEAVVARAIAACAIPVVSGVGHETDTTIADFVADVRAPTPTAAAVAATPDRQALARAVAQRADQLRRSARRDLERRAQRIDALERRLVHPGERVRRQRTALDGIARRLAIALARGVERARWRVERARARLAPRAPDLAARARAIDVLWLRLVAVSARGLERRRVRVDAVGAALAHLDPRAVLARGFAIARDAQGRVVRDAAQLAPGDRLALDFAHGRAQVDVVDGIDDSSAGIASGAPPAR